MEPKLNIDTTEQPSSEIDMKKINDMNNDINSLKDIQQKVMYGVVLIIITQALAATIALTGVLSDIFKKESSNIPVVIITK